MWWMAKAVESNAGAVDVFKPEAGRRRRRRGRRIRAALLTARSWKSRTAWRSMLATGEVFVADSAKGAVYVFSAAGVLEGS